MKNSYILIFILLAFVSCERKIDTVLIDPSSQPSQLSKALNIQGRNVNGAIPTVGLNNGIQIINSASTASVTNGNSLYLPYVISINSSTQIKGVYFQIVGSDNYWDIPVVLSTSSNNYFSYVLDIPIPTNILNGNFKVVYYIYDTNGNISKAINMSVSILPTIDYCDSNGNSSFTTVSGKDGVAVRSYTFGNKEGWVYIDYDTYTVPDRMDIKYNGAWIESTGSKLKNNETPPIKLCNQVTSNDGFVGSEGTFKIYYDPKKSKRIDVYMSGCLSGGTSWEFRVRSCPVP